MQKRDLSWSERAVYACRCGTLFPVTVWRFIDVDEHPDLGDASRRRGPVTGSCPRCGDEAKSAASWLSVKPSAGEAELVLSGDRRADVIGELRDHLARLESRPELALPWLLRPTFVFVDVRDETTARRAVPQGGEDDDAAPVFAPRPIAVSGETRSPSSPLSPVPPPPEPHRDLDAGIPQIIAPDSAPSPSVVTTPAASALGALLGELRLFEGAVHVRADIHGGAFEKWQNAKLEARPVHLRGMGYPLLGVRIVAMYLGDKGCIDAIVDPADPRTSDVFRVLADRFTVEVVLEHGGERVPRRVDGPGLEPNAALCLESARGLLARGEYPPQEFARAKHRLG